MLSRGRGGLQAVQSSRIRALPNASFITAAQAGRLAYKTDQLRGVYADTGTVVYRLGSGVDVACYGAVGDGVTDDAAAIQAAIDAIEATGGGFVWLDGLTYLVGTTITLGGSIILHGQGREATTLKGNNLTAGVIKGSPSGTTRHVGVRDLTVDNTSKANVGGIGIDFTGCDQGHIYDCRVENVETGILVSDAGATNANYIQIYNPDIIEVKKGIHVKGNGEGNGGSNVGTILGGRIDSDGSTGDCIFLEDLGVTTAVTSWSIIGVSIGALTDGIHLHQAIKTYIAGCYFENGINAANGINLTGATRNTTIIEPHFALSGVGATNIANTAGDAYVFIGNQTISIGNEGLAGASDIVLPNNTGDYSGANAAGTAAVRMVVINTDNEVEVAPGGAVTKLPATTKAGSINERTTDAGVTVDGCLIKDGALQGKFRVLVAGA